MKILSTKTVKIIGGLVTLAGFATDLVNNWVTSNLQTNELNDISSKLKAELMEELTAELTKKITEEIAKSKPARRRKK